MRETEQALVVLETFLRQGTGNLKVGLIIKDVEKLAPNRSILPLSDQILDESIVEIETLERWATDMQFKLRGHIILLTSGNIANVTPELALGESHATHPVKVPLPSTEERLRFIRHMLNLPGDDKDENKYKLDLPEGMLSEKFAAMTHGLSLKDIQELWITSKRRKTPVSPNMLVQQNRRAINTRSYGRLGLIYGSHGLKTVGGLESVVSYMKDTIQAMGDAKRVPTGILMVGPPGTGKTMLVRALARDMGMHFVQFRGLHSVGPEARSDWDLYRALDVISSLAPVVVFLDDIDRMRIAGTDTRDQRLMNTLYNGLLEFMSNPNHRGRILWLAASNRPDMIPQEFRRKSIFSDKIPFLLPGAKDREDILRKSFSRNAIPYDNRINFTAPATAASNFTGADLDVVVVRSYDNARKADRDTVIEQDLIKAIGEFVPDHDPNMYEYMMLLAVRETNLATLVPKDLDPGLKDRIYENNKINKLKVNQRLNELASQLGVRRSRRIS